MTRVRIYTYAPQASKITYELKGAVTFKPTGGTEGVPPGVMILDGNETAAYIAAQAFAVILIEDQRLIDVEATPAPVPAEDKSE